MNDFSQSTFVVFKFIFSIAKVVTVLLIAASIVVFQLAMGFSDQSNEVSFGRCMNAFGNSVSSLPSMKMEVKVEDEFPKAPSSMVAKGV